MNSNVVSLGDLGARLRIERVRLGLSQEQMAAKGGVTRNSQSSYEKGKRAFDADYLVSLLNAEVDCGFIVTGVRCGNALPAEATELLTSFDELGGPERDAVLHIVRRMAGRD